MVDSGGDGLLTMVPGILDTPESLLLAKSADTSLTASRSGGASTSPTGHTSERMEDELRRLQAKFAVFEKKIEQESSERERLEKELKLREDELRGPPGRPVGGSSTKDMLAIVENQINQTYERGNYTLRTKLWSIRDELYYIQAFDDFAGGLAKERDELLQREREWLLHREQLEEELRQLRPEGYGKEEGDENDNAAVDEHKIVAKPELYRCEWKTFKTLRALENIGNSLRKMPMSRAKNLYVIDVLEGEPVVTFESFNQSNIWFSRWAQRQDKEDSGVSEEHMVLRRRQAAIPGQAPVPERIRIHSKHVVKILEKIRGESLSSSTNEIDTVVMVRPYKGLFYYRPEILKKLEQLKARFDVQPGEVLVQNSEQTGAPADAPAQPTQPVSPVSPVQVVDTPAKPVEPTEIAKPQQPNQPAAPSAAPESPAEGGDGEHLSTEDNKQKEDDEEKFNEYTFSPTAYQHLRCLVEFMDTEIESKLRYLASEKCQKISFNDIWYFFKPGDEVVGQGRRQVYRVISVSSTGHKVNPPWRNWERSAERTSEVTLSCVYIDFDGKQLGPVVANFVIDRYDGEKAVTSLPVYPLRFAEDRKAIKDGKQVETFREQLIARGRMFLDVAGVKHMHYNGFTLETRDEVDSQVMIDFTEAFAATASEEEKWQPTVESLIGQDLGSRYTSEECSANCCQGEFVYKDHAERKRNEDYIGSLMPEDPTREPSVAIFPRALKDTKSPDNALTDDDLLIMTYRVFGYVLRSRKWAKLDLKYLSPVTSGSKKHETAFDQLVLPTGHKDMVQCLIAQHFRDKEARIDENEEVDIVRGKGKGLIILLHGAPGVGKTTTAEGVAEMFKKPLLQITCGDLGTTASEVEVALERHFALANRWGCILLLDEADVFLAQRSPQDFIRNGLVAVFLRVLEYYAGILFLTTNRIGDFDEAFASRIHVSLYYPPLSRTSTRSIFELNLRLIRKRFEDKGRKIDIEDDAIIKFAVTYWKENKKMRWNGRQIRNACQTALALAEFDAQGGSHESIKVKDAEVKLTTRHLTIVSNAYLEFIRYLKKVYGRDAERRAKEIGIRARELDNRSEDEDDEEDEEGATSIKRTNTGSLIPPTAAVAAPSPSTAPASQPTSAPPQQPATTPQTEASLAATPQAAAQQQTPFGYPPFGGMGMSGFPGFPPNPYSMMQMYSNPDAFAQAMGHNTQYPAQMPAGFPPPSNSGAQASSSMPQGNHGWPGMHAGAWPGAPQPGPARG
ncbi:hypothetical protein B0H67DRAFT_586485 [Lasiosphaeris hirsuta]|uniref:AAA+ ATPase domain-containing protein n=1 Tax=Lasiosphaeris hirsuta TaxID=260670 RepID=A0AA40A9Q8_9PEZI|nr:hypothetical protein B0H67DRAFT_586485 [Lasiosphaeris hirsuta]